MNWNLTFVALLCWKIFIDIEAAILFSWRNGAGCQHAKSTCKYGPLSLRHLNVLLINGRQSRDWSSGSLFRSQPGRGPAGLSPLGEIALQGNWFFTMKGKRDLRALTCSCYLPHLPQIIAWFSAAEHLIKSEPHGCRHRVMQERCR